MPTNQTDSNNAKIYIGIFILFTLILLGLCGALFYIFVYLPSQEKATTERKLDSCLEDVEFAYYQNWANNCETVREGYDKCLLNRNLSLTQCQAIWGDSPSSSKTCSLPNEKAESVEDFRKESKNECYRRYKD